METLEFIIYPDGRVSEQVTGIKGTDCMGITDEIEEQLGRVLSREATAEQFANNALDEDASVSQSQFSGWS
ncbi:MAG: DUF2997 domain-containing protein [Cyanophyceae cyanobacterium]